jgi:hypothetical protein
MILVIARTLYLSRNLEFIIYQNAQIVSNGVREVRVTLTQELGIIEENEMKMNI